MSDGEKQRSHRNKMESIASLRTDLHSTNKTNYWTIMDSTRTDDGFSILSMSSLPR